MSLAPTSLSGFLARPPRPSGPVSVVAKVTGVVTLVTWAVLAGSSFFTQSGLVPLVVPALVVAVGAAVPTKMRTAAEALGRIRPRTFLVAMAILAAVASYLLTYGPMRSRPLSIDGSVYLFQARALAHLQLAADIPEPRQFFGGRFLFEGVDGKLHGVFPIGFPLFLAPFAALSVPLLAGPFVAVLLVFAQAALGRAIEETAAGELGLATRLSILLGVPSFARAVETADLMSHAWVAALGATAIAVAFSPRLRVRGMLFLGACLGWATASRLLDGLVLTTFVSGILLHGAVTRRIDRRLIFLPLLTMLPFWMLVFWQQKAATGSFFVPTQAEYFARSDWPRTCHRLGFGPDVGCTVEHEAERKVFGPEGYGLADAFRVVRERAAGIGIDLLVVPLLALVGFAFVALQGAPRDAILAGLVVTFTALYGLFYYGNSVFHGARHLFPIAPALWLIVARGALAVRGRAEGRFTTENVRAIVVFALISTVTIGGIPRWIASVGRIQRAQAGRVDVRSVLAKNNLDRGLVVVGDEFSLVAGLDPAGDRDLFVGKFDRSGMKDLRRAHPSLPVHSVLVDDVVHTQQLPAPPPGLLLEIERTWPTFIRPSGVGTRVVSSKTCCEAEASGDHVLYVFEARPGASVTIPFTVAQPGRYTLRVDGITGPDQGTWALTLDGVDLPPWDGYDLAKALRRGVVTEPRELSGGRHHLVARCTGKREASSGYLALFDALVGEPVAASP